MTSGDVGSGSADQEKKDLVDEETENENANQDAESPAASGIDDDAANNADQSHAEGEIAEQSASQADPSRNDGEAQTETASQAEAASQTKAVGQTEKSQASSYTQAIGAEYFNITDAEAWPIAGLLVLLDGMHHPVRAELQFYEDLPADIEGTAVKQAKSIMQKKYTAKDPLPLRFVLSVQAPEVMDVQLRPPGTRPRRSQRRPWLPVIMAAAGFVVIIALIWIGVTIFGSSGEETPVAETASTQSSVENVGLTREVASEGSVDGSPATATLDLPQSTNARSEIDIGVRVRIFPGLRLTLRSQAGPTAGEEIGFMTDGAEALVIGGPVTTKGTTDTIVWWYVMFDDCTQAWAAANTSIQTLLEPVP